MAPRESLQLRVSPPTRQVPTRKIHSPAQSIPGSPRCCLSCSNVPPKGLAASWCLGCGFSVNSVNLASVQVAIESAECARASPLTLDGTHGGVIKVGPLELCAPLSPAPSLAEPWLSGERGEVRLEPGSTLARVWPG